MSLKHSKFDLSEAIKNITILGSAENEANIEINNCNNLGLRQKVLDVADSATSRLRGRSDDSKTIEVVKESLSTIFRSLSSFYKKMRSKGDIKGLTEGASSIMACVERGANNLKKFNSVFRDKIVKSTEYSKLCYFYKSAILSKSEAFLQLGIESELKKTMVGRVSKDNTKQSIENLVQEIESKGASFRISTLEQVQQDNFYELFHIKNEFGEAFYDENLLRELTVANTDTKYVGDDPLIQTININDKEKQLLANQIYNECYGLFQSLYEVSIKEAHKFDKLQLKELSSIINSLRMSLMLAKNERCLIDNLSVKPCYRYFNDFILFFRKAVQTEIMKLYFETGLMPSSSLEADFISIILIIGDFICRSSSSTVAQRESLIEKLCSKRKTILEENVPSKFLSKVYKKLTSQIIKYPNGPVFKALDTIREGVSSYDPFAFGFIPEKLYEYKLNNRKVSCYRIASPVIQNDISLAVINDEFKTFLTSQACKEDNVLCINLQKRSSYFEYARCIAMEELVKSNKYPNFFYALYDTDVSYYIDNDLFNKNYIDTAVLTTTLINKIMNVSDREYFFSDNIRHHLSSDLLHGICTFVKEVVFDKKESLEQQEASDFIEAVHNILTMKLTMLVKSVDVFFMSKDGLEVSNTAAAIFLSFLVAAKSKKETIRVCNYIINFLIGSQLVYRDREVSVHNFNKLIGIISGIEKNKNFGKELETALFEKGLFSSFELLEKQD